MSDWTEIALAEVGDERVRQDAKWGQQNHDLFCWLTVLGEEFGEACNAALALRFDANRNADAVQIAGHVRKELVQVAAVAVAMIECLDRNTWQWGEQTVTKATEQMHVRT